MKHYDVPKHEIAATEAEFGKRQFQEFMDLLADPLCWTTHAPCYGGRAHPVAASPKAASPPKKRKVNTQDRGRGPELKPYTLNLDPDS